MTPNASESGYNPEPRTGRRAPAPRLNENHSRRISVTLSKLDEALGEFLQWTAGRQTASTLYSEINTLTPDQRRRIGVEAMAMRKILRQLRDDLRLAPRHRDAAHAITARASLLWESLCELDAKHLGSYGEAPPELEAFLQPRVAELIRGLERIIAVTSGEEEKP